jgi:hypothetical protein
MSLVDRTNVLVKVIQLLNMLGFFLSKISPL